MEFCAYRHAHCEVAGSTDYDHYSLFCQEPDPRGYHNRYKCKLCETRFMAQRDLNEHCSSDAHQSRLRQVVSLRRDGVVKCCALLQKLLDGVTNKIFRKEIEHELYMILLNNRFDEAHPVHNLLSRMEVRINECLAQERIALLEVVAWKAMCVVENPSSFGTGWQKCKDEQRESNAIGIIVRSVRPFIG